MPQDYPQDDAGGNVEVTVSPIQRPDSLVSGDVVFSDGTKAEWRIDRMGQLGLIPQDGKTPPQSDHVHIPAQIAGNVEPNVKAMLHIFYVAVCLLLARQNKYYDNKAHNERICYRTFCVYDVFFLRRIFSGDYTERSVVSGAIVPQLKKSDFAAANEFAESIMSKPAKDLPIKSAFDKTGDGENPLDFGKGCLRAVGDKIRRFFQA